MKNRILLFTAALTAVSLLLSGCAPELGTETSEQKIKSDTKSSVYTSESIDEPTYESTFSEPETDVSDADIIYDAFVAGLQDNKESIWIDSNVWNSDINLALNKTIRYHPEFFWLGGYHVTTSYSKSKITIKNLPDIVGRDDIPSMRNELEAAADNIIAMIPPGSDTFGKIVFVHDYIVEHTDYDSKAAIEILSGGNGLYGTAYGCLVQGNAICQGYALGFMYIMQKLGINCGFVSGETERGDHAWNYVEVDGTNYWIDVTWDDPSSNDDPTQSGTNQENVGNLRHVYCLINDDLLLRSRTISDNIEYIPVCSSMADNYYRRNNAYFYSYDKAGVRAVLIAGASERKAEMMFSSREALDETMDGLFTQMDFWELSDEMLHSEEVTYSIEEDLNVLWLSY